MVTINLIPSEVKSYIIFEGRTKQYPQKLRTVFNKGGGI